MTLRSRSTLRTPLSAYRGHGEAVALHCIFFLTGMGVLIVGPMLPAISQRWHLDDRSSGLLLGAQFLGSFLGAATLGRDSGTNLIVGCAAIVAGFGCVAPAVSSSSGFVWGVCGFLLAGFGLGRAITAINLIAGARYARRRASALSLLNLTWGLGALIGPVVADRTAFHFGLVGLFVSLSAINAIVMTSSLLLLGQGIRPVSEGAGGVATTEAHPGIQRKIIFVALAFLSYGGIEACLSGWISSLTARSIGGTVHLGATATTTLWIGMAAGRAVAALVLLRVAERTLLKGALLCSGLLTLALLLPGAGGELLVLLSFGLGLSLAAVFPTLCSLLLANKFPASTVGRVMAATALGGAIFPWLVGFVSERTGVLQNGLWIPVALCAILAALVPGFAPQDGVGAARG